MTSDSGNHVCCQKLSSVDVTNIMNFSFVTGGGEGNWSLVCSNTFVSSCYSQQVYS